MPVVSKPWRHSYLSWEMIPQLALFLGKALRLQVLMGNHVEVRLPFQLFTRRGCFFVHSALMRCPLSEMQLSCGSDGVFSSASCTRFWQSP